MTSAPSTSLDQLEREAERNRAVLVDTVDALRETILGEVEDVRRKVSIGYIKSEISDYARSTGSAWYGSAQDSIRNNPLRAFAIGAGLTVPLWKIGRSVPMPLVLIGAGVALARPAARGAVGDMANRAATGLTIARDRSSDMAGSALDGVKATGAQASEQFAAGLDKARQTVRSVAQDAASRVSDVFDSGAGAASGLADKGSALLQGGSDKVAGARDYAGRTAAQTHSAAMDLFHRNPLLVAGAGVAIGALIAAILPTTDVEGRLLDNVVPSLKQKATDVIDDGYEAVTTAANDLYDGAVGRAKDHGLSPEGAQGATTKLGEKLGAVIDAAVGHADETHSDPAPART